MFGSGAGFVTILVLLPVCTTRARGVSSSKTRTSTSNSSCWTRCRLAVSSPSATRPVETRVSSVWLTAATSKIVLPPSTVNSVPIRYRSSTKLPPSARVTVSGSTPLWLKRTSVGAKNTAVPTFCGVYTASGAAVEKVCTILCRSTFSRSASLIGTTVSTRSVSQFPGVNSNDVTTVSVSSRTSTSAECSRCTVTFWEGAVESLTV